MSEDSIFMVNVEQYLIIAFQMKQTPENIFILFRFHVHEFWICRKKTKFTANAVLKNL